MALYKIVRWFWRGESKTIKTGLTLEEAQKHCKNPETSSRTCTNSEGKRLTEENGPWFDAYEEM